MYIHTHIHTGLHVHTPHVRADGCCRHPASKPTHTDARCTLTHTHTHVLILQGMGEFRASLISSAAAYHPEPERGRGRLGVGVGEELGKLGKRKKIVGGWKQGEGSERIEDMKKIIQV